MGAIKQEIKTSKESTGRFVRLYFIIFARSASDIYDELLKLACGVESKSVNANQ